MCVCVCSGPCVTLILTKGDTGEGVVEEIRELVGPKDVELAKECAPERYLIIIMMSHVQIPFLQHSVLVM